MANKEATLICGELTALLKSKLLIDFCDIKRLPACAMRLEQEVRNLKIFNADIGARADRLLVLYWQDQELHRPLLLLQTLTALESINGVNLLYDKHFRRLSNKGRCDRPFLILIHEWIELFQGYKRLLCAHIFNDLPYKPGQLVSFISPYTALENFTKEVPVILVEPTMEEAIKLKKRFELLLESGFFQFAEIRFLPQIQQLQKASKIIDCNLRYAQELKKDFDQESGLS